MTNLNSSLVSIVVITYNSSNFILETLESAKFQKYQNVELIISDDGSKDNTVEICENWLLKNKESFKRVRMITVPLNTGIPSNVNRGVNAANGEWIKLIAGDDILLANCISDNIDYINSNPNAKFVFSKPVYIDKESNLINNFEQQKSFNENDPFFNLSPRKQYLHLLIKNHPINPPTLFFNKAIVDKLGGFNENYKNEDFPLYLKVTKEGYKLHFFYKETVKYRIHSSSISIKIRTEEAVTPWIMSKWSNTIHSEINFNLFVSNPLVVIDFYNRLLFYKTVVLLGNSKSIKNRLTFIRWISPLVFVQKLKKIFN